MSIIIIAKYQEMGTNKQYKKYLTPLYGRQAIGGWTVSVSVVTVSVEVKEWDPSYG